MKQINSFKKEGIQKLLSGEYECAITSFTKAIEINPSDFEVYWKRGVAKSRLNNYESANEDFIKSDHFREKFNQIEDQKKAQLKKEHHPKLNYEEGQINNAYEIRYEEGNYAYMADKLSLLFSRMLKEKIKKAQEEKNLYLKLLKNCSNNEALENEYLDSRRHISKIAFLRYFYRDFSNSLANVINSSSYKYPLEIFCIRILISTYYSIFDEKVDCIEIPKVKSDLILKLLDYICRDEENWVKINGRQFRECTDEIINELIINDMDLLEKNDPDSYLNQYEIKPSINPFDKGHPFLERSSLSRNDFKFWKREHFFNIFDYKRFKLIVHSALEYAIKEELSFWIFDTELIEI